jgi:hypothetical protein
VKRANKNSPRESLKLYVPLWPFHSQRIELRRLETGVSTIYWLQFQPTLAGTFSKCASSQRTSVLSTAHARWIHDLPSITTICKCCLVESYIRKSVKRKRETIEKKRLHRSIICDREKKQGFFNSLMNFSIQTNGAQSMGKIKSAERE